MEAQERFLHHFLYFRRIHAQAGQVTARGSRKSRNNDTVQARASSSGSAT